MMNSIRRHARFELLPTELLYEIITRLSSRDVKRLSSVSERLRKVCLPYLFRNVSFEFSRSGFISLQRLLLSNLRWYVVSLTYVVPELLQSEIMDFRFFRNNILPPKNYLDELKQSSDKDCPAKPPPPYMVIYDTFRGICKEQHDILKRREDIEVLSAALGQQLPKLTGFCVYFRRTNAKEHWVGSYLDTTMTMQEKTLEHHFHAIIKGLKT
ncbi:hypothetical protein P170DRAFT_174660 [Aspergillus steynii IBT 23096]|uniref:F-box domain-containing protein n=1 Tax=Aspergillus steynii IBT 23096 TaxID=1392250 RepID=A0A2I2G869_9EURO|nr:uncharacterized protein P170DRAFT_174660 [Aspergillus steynii IBT 23096]PLB49079.1 hypothetical protein P170DRAFT_174660 [Aspergillus steynii IBT 23096]